MRPLLKHYPGFLFFFLIMLVASCREQLNVDNTDQNFPLTVNAQKDEDKVVLTWEAANVSNFNKYVIVRSRNPIPAGLSPVFSSGDIEIVFQSDDIDTTSFTDEALPVLQQLYYKLYINIDDRFIESAAVSLTFDNLLLEGNGSVIKFYPDSNWVILGDDFMGTLRVVNYNTKEVVASRNVSFTSFDNMCYDIAVENGKPVLYWWAGYTNFYKYQLPDLVQLNYWPVAFSGFSIAVDDNYVYTTQYDYNQSFCARRKSDMSVVQPHYRADYYTHRTLAILDKATHYVLEVSPYRLLTYNVNPINGDVTNITEKSTNTFNLFYRDIPVSKDNQYVVPQYDGSVYDRNLNLVTSIPFMSNGYIDVDFSADGQYLYALYQDFTFGNGSLIQKFTFPGMQQVASRRFNNIAPRTLETVPGGVIFVGSGVNGLNQILVKKVTL
ncbi:MAG: hypothetical protein JNM22_15540 [Saprospiraceae bacterium]|nr:hypothetical protein [Saprospiraceae bacterium]